MVLPDVLETGMKVVFCGTAVGDKSARREAFQLAEFVGVVKLEIDATA